MLKGDDPVQAVHTLAPYIVHTHAKDGVMLNEKVDGRAYLELPLGKGGVPWDGYLQALKDVGFGGFLTIEREVGDDPTADIAMAVDFLKARI